MNNKRLDIDALNELKEMLEDEFNDLIETYKLDMSQKAETLSDEISGLNDDSIRKLAHSMKGASLNIGVLQFSDLCSRLEEDAKSNRQTNYVSHLQLINQELQAVFLELDSFIA